MRQHARHGGAAAAIPAQHQMCGVAMRLAGVGAVDVYKVEELAVDARKRPARMIRVACLAHYLG